MKGRRRLSDTSIDLGLAVSALTLREGQSRSHEEIAAFCACSKRAIQKIEQRALAKLRMPLRSVREELFIR